MSGERAIVFGGSFNPPHTSHERIVELLLEHFPGHCVWVIPTHRHPFSKRLAPFAERIAMCRLAFGRLGERARVLELERELGGISYTINTIEGLRQRYPGVDLKLVVGSDVLAERAHWKDFARLKRLIDFVIIPRAGHPTTDPAALPIEPLPGVSSTEIRRRVREGLPLDELVSPAVVSHISAHNLYRTEDDERLVNEA